MSVLHLPLLELAIVTPLLGAVLAARADADRARRIALAATLVAMALGVGAWYDLAAVHAFSAHDRWTLLGWLPGGDPLSVDELSAPLLPLASLQFALTILATLRSKARRFSFASTLISEAIVLATFATRSPWALTLLLGLSAVPPAIEILRRGGSPRVLLLHLGAATALLAGGIAAGGVPEPGQAASTIGVGLVAAAILIRAGVVPGHLWLLDLFSQASFGTAILFAAPMTGAYAALRLLLPTAPDGALRLVALAGLATAVYAAATALVESDARRFFARLLLSHASLVLVGLEVANLAGLTGALFLWLSVGLAMTGFGLALRCVESRVGATRLDRYHGLHDAAPALAGLFLLTGLASIGFPGTLGFVALEALVEGSLHASSWIGVIIIVATALCGVAATLAYFRVFTGTEHVGTINLDVRGPERIAVALLSALIVGGGLLPQPGLSSRRHAAAALLEERQQGLATAQRRPSLLAAARAPGRGPAHSERARLLPSLGAAQSAGVVRPIQAAAVRQERRPHEKFSPEERFP